MNKSLLEISLQSLYFLSTVFVVRKHPSGIFSSIVIISNGQMNFPKFEYARINPPLDCNCFVKASNARYLLAGKKINDRYYLNNIVPLFEIRSFDQIKRFLLRWWFRYAQISKGTASLDEVDKSANLLGKVNMIYDLIGCKKW